jgi:SAM-dependent methyltransferase
VTSRPSRNAGRVVPGTARCLVCLGSSTGELYRLSRRSILRCRDCTQVFLWPLPTEDEIAEEFAHLYTTGESPLPELRDYYRFCYDDGPGNPLTALYDHWLATVERVRPPGRILDVGCGTGLFLSVARRRGWTSAGVDGSLEATRFAREHFGLDVETGEFATAFASGRQFEAVTMWDVIEHSRDPIGLLRAARGCLAPGGVLGLSTPNQRSVLDVVAGAMYRASGGRVIAPLEKFYIDQHFLYFAPDTLRGALARAGFELVHLARELTELQRLTVPWHVRFGLRTLFRVARWTGLENRLFVVAAPAPVHPGGTVGVERPRVGESE